MGFHFSRLLVSVWHEATHKVGLAVVQLKVWSHQTHLSKSIISLKQAPPWPEPSTPWGKRGRPRRRSFHLPSSSSFLPLLAPIDSNCDLDKNNDWGFDIAFLLFLYHCGLAWMIFPQLANEQLLNSIWNCLKPHLDQKLTFRCWFHDLDHRVVDRILVLLQPVGDIVGHNTSIVRDGKVSILVSLRLRFQENGKLSQGCLQFLFKWLVGGLREEGLLLEDGPDAHWLLKHDDGGGEVHPKVNHHPVDALLDILLLLNNKPRDLSVRKNVD